MRREGRTEGKYKEITQGKKTEIEKEESGIASTDKT